jgi:hypothetical protein
MHVVGFAGLARGGKTTTARLLFDWCEQNGMNPMLYSFAQPMKRAAKRIGLDKDSDPELYRKTLQRWGESRRDPKYKPGITGPDYWVNRVLVELLEIQIREQSEYSRLDQYGWNRVFKETVVIFDDMRYANEVELVKTLNGTTVFVDGSFRLKDLGAEWRQHESERLATAYTTMSIPYNTFDYYVKNYDSESKLKQLVETSAPVWIDTPMSA